MAGKKIQNFLFMKSELERTIKESDCFDFRSIYIAPRKCVLGV